MFGRLVSASRVRVASERGQQVQLYYFIPSIFARSSVSFFGPSAAHSADAILSGDGLIQTRVVDACAGRVGVFMRFMHCIINTVGAGLVFMAVWVNCMRI